MNRSPEHRLNISLSIELGADPNEQRIRKTTTINKIDEQVYRFWWLHDGAWYRNVAGRFGFEVANELNGRHTFYVAGGLV